MTTVSADPYAEVCPDLQRTAADAMQTRARLGCRAVTEADVIRWVGVVVGVLGAGVAASNGVRMVAAGLARWVRGALAKCRRYLARWLPFLRRSVTVQATAAMSFGTALAATASIHTAWDPTATERQQIEWLHDQFLGLRREIAEVRQAASERHANLTARVDAIDSAWRDEVADLRGATRLRGK